MYNYNQYKQGSFGMISTLIFLYSLKETALTGNHCFQIFSKRMYFSINLSVKVSGKATLSSFFLLGLFCFGYITISSIISVVIFLIVVITIYNVITLRFVVVDHISLIFLLTYTIWSQHLAKSAIRQWLT